MDRDSFVKNALSIVFVWEKLNYIHAVATYCLLTTLFAYFLDFASFLRLVIQLHWVLKLIGFASIGKLISVVSRVRRCYCFFASYFVCTSRFKFFGFHFFLQELSSSCLVEVRYFRPSRLSGHDVPAPNCFALNSPFLNRQIRSVRRQNKDVHCERKGISKKGWMGFHGETVRATSSCCSVLLKRGQIIYVMFAFVYLNQFIRELIEGH